MTSTFKMWVQLSMLSAAVAVSGAAFGQADFLSIFGTGTSSCPLINRFNCTINPSPASCYGEPNLTDADPSTDRDLYKNAVYSSNGTLLFSVTVDGIYGADAGGTKIYSFNGGGGSMVYFGAGSSTPLPCGSSTYPAVTKINSISEIVCFPVPGQCGSFYVCYWTQPNDGNIYAWLVAIQVTVTPNFGITGFPVSSWYTVTPNFITQPTCSGSSYVLPDYPVFGFTGGQTGYEIVADAPNGDGSRDLYTISVNGVVGSGGGYSWLYSVLSQWHIGPTGSLPVNSPTVLSTNLPLAFSTKAKLFNVNGDKTFAYVASPWGTSGIGYELATYDLSSGNIYHYAAPVAAGMMYPFVRTGI